MLLEEYPGSSRLHLSASLPLGGYLFLTGTVCKVKALNSNGSEAGRECVLVYLHGRRICLKTNYSVVLFVIKYKNIIGYI